MMAQLLLCLICALGWVAFGSISSEAGVTVDTTFLPETCSADARKTKENDGIILHYTGE
jgi:hypothetical protein